MLLGSKTSAIRLMTSTLKHRHLCESFFLINKHMDQVLSEKWKKKNELHGLRNNMSEVATGHNQKESNPVWRKIMVFLSICLLFLRVIPISTTGKLLKIIVHVDTNRNLGEN